MRCYWSLLFQSSKQQSEAAACASALRHPLLVSSSPSLAKSVGHARLGPDCSVTVCVQQQPIRLCSARAGNGNMTLTSIMAISQSPMCAAPASGRSLFEQDVLLCVTKCALGFLMQPEPWDCL
jgi:hypothetical protein